MATFLDSLLPSVHDMLSAREALSKLAQCERTLRTQGPTSILGIFDVLYSCLHHVNALKQENLDELMSMLIRGLLMLEIELKKALSEGIRNSEQRVRYLNTLKMFVYLSVELANHMEKKQSSSKENDLMPTSKARKRPAKTQTRATTPDMSLAESSTNFDWNEIREKLLDALAKLVQLNIQKLWDPPIAEEQFVIIISNLCYKLMENLGSQGGTSLRPQQKKGLRDYLCHILGLLIKKYNHSYGACVMIIQTLPHYEHLSALYADLVHTCVVQLGYEAILPDLLREFRHANSATTSKTQSSAAVAENPNIKYHSQFLMDLADRLASNLLNYLSLIQDLLDDDSYLMRSAILHLYGELIVKVLNEKNTTSAAAAVVLNNEDDEAISSELKLKQMRNELLDTLLEHVHDCNALARSRTLQIWRRICEENAVPISYINELMQRCIGRMEDVASSVRKSAFQLLCDLIRKNPYGISSLEMSIEQVKQEWHKEEEILKRMSDEAERQLIDDVNAIPQSSAVAEQEQTGVQSDPSSSNQNQQQKQHQMIIVQKSKVNYLKDMHKFVKQIESAIPKLSSLLFSKTQTDVLEVISFFVTCYEHGLSDMLLGIRKMLSLIMFAEKTIKDAVVAAYKRLYLSTPNSNPLQIAKQLIKLVNDLTLCERDALEELIGEFINTGELNNNVVQVLWELFTNNDPQVSATYSHNALILLGMIIKKVPEKGRANIQVLIDAGLRKPINNLDDQNANEENRSRLEESDILRYAETFLALSYISLETNAKKLSTGSGDTQEGTSAPLKNSTNKSKDSKLRKGEQKTQIKSSSVIEPFKLPNNHQLFERICDIVCEQFTNQRTVYWSNMTENAILCIFKLADNPIVLSDSLLNDLIEKLPPLKMLNGRSSISQAVTTTINSFGDETMTSISTQQTAADEKAFICDSMMLARFYTFVGLLATKLLVFLNQSLVCELKRRKLCSENDNAAGNKTTLNKSGININSSTARARRKSLRSLKSFNSEPAIEEEMGLQGAEAEDAELVLIESLIEQRIAVSQQTTNNISMIAQLLPGIVHILKEPHKYSDEHLQLACAMSLVRIMLLSPQLCSKYLQLLFTLMEKSTNMLVRSQLIIGVGDLVYRFPNALEPWTSHLYVPLRDKSTQVRMNTIRVLSHLILKEMIKTRGQIFEIAICTIDADQRISALSKLFFSELAQRNNGLVIYNAMPDIISQLSGGGGGGSVGNERIDEESFRNIVTYLFSFIKRDKQCETLIEKLCHAFRQANTSERKCRDLAFCLSKIQMSESGIKKLKETFKWYADKLCISAVYEIFKQNILKNARKLPMIKNETKLLIDELEKEIENIRKKGINEEENIDENENN
jgi:condensin complex subunit 1